MLGVRLPLPEVSDKLTLSDIEVTTTIPIQVSTICSPDIMTPRLRDLSMRMVIYLQVKDFLNSICLENARREIAVGNVSGFQKDINNIAQIFSGVAEDELKNLMGR